MLKLEELIKTYKEINEDLIAINEDKEKCLNLIEIEMLALGIDKIEVADAQITIKDSNTFNSTKFQKYAKEHQLTPVTKTTTDWKKTAETNNVAEEFITTTTKTIVKI